MCDVLTKRFKWSLMVSEVCLASHQYVLISLSDGKNARVEAEEGKLIIQQTANSVDEIKCS